MIALILFVLGILASPFKAKSRLEAENAALRQQLIVLRRKVKSRPRLANTDRWLFVQLYRWFPSILDVLTIIRPETLVRWHRAGFRRYWHWKSRRRGGPPQVQSELRALIRQMSVENPLWARRASTANCSSSGLRFLNQASPNTWLSDGDRRARGGGAFLRNHAPDIAAMDLFVVPTIGFELLYAFVIVRLDRRDLIWIDVTRHPTAEWIARL